MYVCVCIISLYGGTIRTPLHLQIILYPMSIWPIVVLRRQLKTIKSMSLDSNSLSLNISLRTSFHLWHKHRSFTGQKQVILHFKHFQQKSQNRKIVGFGKVRKSLERDERKVFPETYAFCWKVKKKKKITSTRNAISGHQNKIKKKNTHTDVARFSVLACARNLLSHIFSISGNFDVIWKQWRIKQEIDITAISL